MRISDWSSDVCSSDLSRRRCQWSGRHRGRGGTTRPLRRRPAAGTRPRRQEWRYAWARGPRGGLKEGGPASVFLPGGKQGDRKSVWRERVCHYVEISVVAGSFKQKDTRDYTHHHTL